MYRCSRRSMMILTAAALLGTRAKDEPSYKRFKLMEAGWLALAREQDWLDGVTPPNRKAS